MSGSATYEVVHDAALYVSLNSPSLQSTQVSSLARYFPGTHARVGDAVGCLVGLAAGSAMGLAVGAVVGAAVPTSPQFQVH
jgi:transketolase C-terminal domain/subunit